MDVDNLLDELTPQEFDRWIAYDMVEPIGTRKVEKLLSIIGAFVGNQWQTDEAKVLTPQDISDLADGKPLKDDGEELSPEEAVRAIRGMQRGQ